jgi:hypothetical protein
MTSSDGSPTSDPSSRSVAESIATRISKENSFEILSVPRNDKTLREEQMAAQSRATTIATAIATATSNATAIATATATATANATATATAKSQFY